MDDHSANPYRPGLMLVQWLIFQTEQGRLSWKIENDNVTASVSLPPRVHVRFYSFLDGAGKQERWVWFSIHSEDSELLHVDRNQSVNGDTMLRDAVNTLFVAALKSLGVGHS